MEYGIYVYGGGEILWKIFNGLALLFQSKSAYFTSVGKLTMGIGVLYAAAQALPRASLPIFFKSWFLPTFLLVALFYGPKTSVLIIDKVNPDFKVSKVDHIPIGITAVASLSTQLSEYLTEAIETVFTTSQTAGSSVISDSGRFSKVGPMFGAKLIHGASTLTIRDPLIKENLKDFTRQCFAWPYIFSNIAPGKKAAMETEDMLAFIEANPHPLLGIYWREANGQSAFVNCKECAIKVREIIPIEVNAGLQALALKFFNTSGNTEAATTRLKQYFGDAWQNLAKGSSDAANVIQQELMLNSYRSALMDKRDELGLGRYNTELLNLNAERGQAQQDSSFLVKAALSGSQVPTIHTIMMALALIYFAIIAPMTFLPGGMSMLSTWVKVMVWLATWPVMFTVLNCLGQMFAMQSISGTMVGYGQGLSLMTQTGMADAAYTAYCWVMGLQYTVPFLSWALISGGGYAFSQLASSFTQSGEAFAGKAGAEIVDGNVSFDSQSLHTKSVANAQMAQQQLGTNFNTGDRFDDGKMALIHGPNGSVVAQEHQHNFGTNLSRNDAFSQMAGMQSQMAINAAQSEGINMQKAISLGTNEISSFAQSVAETKGINEGFGSTESVALQQQFQSLKQQSDRFADDHNFNRQAAFDALVEASVGIGKGSDSKGDKDKTGFARFLRGGIDAKGGFKAGASDNEIVARAKSSGFQKQFSDGLNTAINYAMDNKASIGTNFNTQALDQAQAHFNRAETHADTMSSQLSLSESLAKTASTSRQMGASTVTNDNEAVLSSVANRFGGDRVAAANYMAQHPEATQRMGKKFIGQAEQQSNAKISTAADVEQFYEKGKERVGPAPIHNPAMAEMREQNNMTQQEQSLDQQIAEKRAMTKQEFEIADASTQAGIKELDVTHQQLKDKYDQEENRTLVGKTFRKAGNNISALKNTVQSVFGDKE